MPYEINKSVSKSLEFKGFTGKYILLLAAGVVTEFVLFFIFKITGVPTSIALGFIGASLVLFLVWLGRFYKKYGEHGYEKHLAVKQCPRHILYRKTLKRLLKNDNR